MTKKKKPGPLHWKGFPPDSGVIVDWTKIGIPKGLLDGEPYRVRHPAIPSEKPWMPSPWAGELFWFVLLTRECPTA